MARPRTRVVQPRKPHASIRLRAAVILVAGVLAYANNLSGPFVFDDNDAIVNNNAIRRIANVSDVLVQHDTPIAGRPITALSFALNYAAGGLAVQSYHLTNIGVHLLCALLLLGLLRQTLRLPQFRNRLGTGDTGVDGIAFACALIWTIHPLNTETVNYLTQRSESLMALFLLLTLYCSIRAARSKQGGMWQALAVLACAAGMACKESMVVAPLIVVLYDRIFLYSSWRDIASARWRLYGGLAVTFLLLAYFMLPGPRQHTVGVLVNPWTYLLNQARMVARYLRLSFWPAGLVINYGPPVALRLTEVLPQAILIVSLVIGTIAALWWHPAIGFLGAWTFITLAPTSTIIPIATEVGAERRMYLPLMGVVTLTVIGIWRLAFVRNRLSRSASEWTLATIVFALAATTFVRNREYASPLLLAESVLQRWPTDVAHAMVGGELAMLHRDDEAIRELRLGARTNPRARFNLGVALFNVHDYDGAIRELRGYADENSTLSEVPLARRIVGHAYMVQRRYPEAINQLTLVLSMTPADSEARKLLVEALNSQGMAMADAGKFAEAIAAFRRATNTDSADSSSSQNLAAALLDNREPAAAETELRRAIRIGAPNAGLYDLLGRALALQGKMDEAIAQLRRALELDPNDAQVKEDLSKVQNIR